MHSATVLISLHDYMRSIAMRGETAVGRVAATAKEAPALMLMMLGGGGRQEKRGAMTRMTIINVHRDCAHLAACMLASISEEKRREVLPVKRPPAIGLI